MGYRALSIGDAGGNPYRARPWAWAPQLTRDMPASDSALPRQNRTASGEPFEEATNSIGAANPRRSQRVGEVLLAPHAIQMVQYRVILQGACNRFADGLALFHVFLSREYSEENIEFWLACEELKTCRHNKLSIKAQRIFDEFIAPDSPKEVNLDAPTRAEVSASIAKRPDRDCLALAQRRVQGLLERDAYLRFLQCELYLELCRP
ncbi:hypothetical protein HPB48_006675 [Haemaphysalis longicornis]|uniref:RGS domain-containing protein n=1 Tax=Haemaphysalis longicornis TaxID=44386 RepID=A0A9J6F6R7_HAELO|nr:hypothetical protein HPB48_006675 [Haemaphysalis longicornis]